MGAFLGALVGAAIPGIVASVGWFLQRRQERSVQLRLLSDEIRSNWEELDAAVAASIPLGPGSVSDREFMTRRDVLARVLGDETWQLLNKAYDDMQQAELRAVSEDAWTDLFTTTLFADVALDSIEKLMPQLGIAVPLRWAARFEAHQEEWDRLSIDADLAMHATGAALDAFSRVVEEQHAQLTPEQLAFSTAIREALAAGLTTAEVARRIRERNPDLSSEDLKRLNNVVVLEAKRLRLSGSNSATAKAQH